MKKENEMAKKEEGKVEKVNVKATVKEENEKYPLEERFYWIIGIAVITFMILILGSIIGLKITEKGLNNIVNNSSFNNNEVNVANYAVLEDGTKQNMNENIQNASFEFDGLKIDNFTVRENGGLSLIQARIQNTSSELINNVNLSVKLLDEAGEEIARFVIINSGLEPNNTTTVASEIIGDCSDAYDVVVENNNK